MSVGNFAATKRSNKETSMAAIFAVASELSRRGYDVELVSEGVPKVNLICSGPIGKRFKVQVKGSSGKESFPAYVFMQKELLEAAQQEDLFLVVVLVPPPEAVSGMRFFVLSHADALREWNSLSDNRKDGTPYDRGSTYWGLYLKQNVEPYEGKWDKLPD